MQRSSGKDVAFDFICDRPIPAIGDDSESTGPAEKLALPPELSKWLWRSSWMHLISCAVALSIPVYDCALSPGIVFITSLNYWRHADYSWRRYFDIVLVQPCLWWQVIRNVDAQEPNRSIAFTTTAMMIATFGIAMKVYATNIKLSTFLHMVVHFLGNVSSIVIVTGNLPDYRDAWYTRV